MDDLRIVVIKEEPFNMCVEEDGVLAYDLRVTLGVIMPSVPREVTINVGF